MEQNKNKMSLKHFLARKKGNSQRLMGLSKKHRNELKGSPLTKCGKTKPKK